jgi:hypothetical protein
MHRTWKEVGCAAIVVCTTMLTLIVLAYAVGLIELPPIGCG